MIRTQSSQEVYLKQLNWFIDNKDIHTNISNSGKPKRDQKWWLIWNRGQYSHEQYRRQLKGMRNSGYNLPDYDVMEKESHLVAEPVRWESYEIHECKKCGHTLKEKIGK